jgi:hypothetical protein
MSIVISVHEKLKITEEPQPPKRAQSPNGQMRRICFLLICGDEDDWLLAGS